MEHLIEKLEARAEGYKRYTNEYRELQETAKDEATASQWENEKNFWLGMWRATETALDLVRQEEETE